MPIRRTTLAAERDDLAALEAEARRREISLAQLLRELVAKEAGRLRRQR
ncbi:MAG: ribbon-helix-helix protein, CopG family, partial [Candidatus Methylomirabilales bacterium]